MLQQRFWIRGGGSPLAALAAFVTTLCCLGFPALVGFFSALGAGFLINDRYLEPLLIGTLALTLAIVGLHLRRHHQPWPFIFSVVAAASVFFAIYGIRWLPQAASSGTTHDHMADSMAPLPAWSAPLSYGAIVVLLGAQVWDLWLYRQCARAGRAGRVSPEPSGTPEPRKEQV